MALSEDDNFAPKLEDVVNLGVFFMSIYAGSKAVSLLKGPSLVGEIGVGILWLGMGILPLYLTNALQVVGSLGLLLMVFDGGVNMDLQELRKQGLRAFVLAFAGLILPIVIVCSAMVLLGYTGREGLACGIVLSSTAIGFTLSLMNDAGLLSTPMGQLIASAAMIDDVMSIIALAVLSVLAVNSDMTESPVWPLVRPAVMSAVIVACCLVLRGTLSKALQAIRCWRAKKVEKKPDSESPADVEQESQEPPQDWKSSLAIFLAFSFGLSLCWGAEELQSTYLLGVFMAGMVATAWTPFTSEWEKKCDLSIVWLSRIFFACSVGFQVPLNDLANAHPLEVALLTLAAVLGKFLSGLWAAPACSDKCFARSVQVGSAMVGRGEIGFLVATNTFQLGLLSAQGYSATLWALLLATVLGPIMFKLSLKLGTDSKIEQSHDRAPGLEI